MTNVLQVVAVANDQALKITKIMDFKKRIIDELKLTSIQADTMLKDYIEVCEKLAKEYHALQLQQTGVIESVCEINKEFEGCPLFKQYSNGCYGCKYRKPNRRALGAGLTCA